MGGKRMGDCEKMKKRTKDKEGREENVMEISLWERGRTRRRGR